MFICICRGSSPHRVCCKWVSNSSFRDFSIGSKVFRKKFQNTFHSFHHLAINKAFKLIVRAETIFSEMFFITLHGVFYWQILLCSYYTPYIIHYYVLTILPHNVCACCLQGENIFWLVVIHCSLAMVLKVIIGFAVAKDIALNFLWLINALFVVYDISFFTLKFKYITQACNSEPLIQADPGAELKQRLVGELLSMALIYVKTGNELHNWPVATVLPLDSGMARAGHKSDPSFAQVNNRCC